MGGGNGVLHSITSYCGIRGGQAIVGGVGWQLVGLAGIERGRILVSHKEG
jgi:hypothetical protein